MLTRQAINSGAYLEHFESLPNLWTQARIEQSLAETLERRPEDAHDLWIFAYGSLMWNPMVEFDRREVATLHDWHRSFCLRLIIGRGSEERPGRMLALEPGGCTQGVALRVPQAKVKEELQVIWVREMVLGSYQPTWAPVTLDDGTETHAIAFVADPSRDQFEADSRVATVAPLVALASGILGTNVEYLFKLQVALHDSGLRDDYVDELVREVEPIAPPLPPPAEPDSTP